MSQRNLKARIWPYTNPFTFPEQEQHQQKKTSGICFSGGGNRAYAAAIGQLRALHHLNQLSQYDYISAVSGGSWAATIFTYAQQELNTLLGPLISDPNHLNTEALNYSTPNYMGTAASQNLFQEFHQNRKHSPTSQVWINTVGNIYLKPYGLNDANKYLTQNNHSLQNILTINSQLTPQHFYQPNQRPYLIVNSSLIWPDNLLKKENRLLFQFTSAYTGILNPEKLKTRKALFFEIHRDFGGGFLQTFALDSSAPSHLPTDDYVSIHAPKKPVNLAKMIGSSSAFFASFADRLPIARRLVPEFHYWPINSHKIKSFPYRIGDGGNLENYGLLPLLQRQVDFIIVFINSETKIHQPHQNTFKEWEGIDEYLPPLFGHQSLFWKADDGHPSTQVFDPSLFNSLLSQFQKCIDQGITVSTRTQYTIKNNKRFNISNKHPDGSPYTPTILWIYNNPVKKWQDLLPVSLQNELNKKSNNPFPNFPNYSTIDETFDVWDPKTWYDWGGLSQQQVNLLAHFSAWNVLQLKLINKTPP